MDNDGDGSAEISCRFEFSTVLRDTGTFLYNAGPIRSLDSPAWNRRQFYSMTRVSGTTEDVLARGLACPPCNIGPPKPESAAQQPHTPSTRCAAV